MHYNTLTEAQMEESLKIQNSDHFHKSCMRQIVIGRTSWGKPGGSNPCSTRGRVRRSFPRKQGSLKGDMFPSSVRAHLQCSPSSTAYPRFCMGTAMLSPCVSALPKILQTLACDIEIVVQSGVVQGQQQVCAESPPARCPLGPALPNFGC